MAYGKIIADQIQHSSEGTVDTQFVVNGSIKYWVHIDGTGAAAIRGSFNTSTITDNGTGDYTGNFTNNFNSTDNMAAPRGSSFSNITTVAIAATWSRTAATSSLQHQTYRADNSIGDTEDNTQSCLGDLA